CAERARLQSGIDGRERCGGHHPGRRNRETQLHLLNHLLPWFGKCRNSPMRKAPSCNRRGPPSSQYAAAPRVSPTHRDAPAPAHPGFIDARCAEWIIPSRSIPGDHPYEAKGARDLPDPSYTLTPPSVHLVVVVRVDFLAPGAESRVCGVFVAEAVDAQR